MKLTRIELQNYRPFKGPHHMDFHTNGNHITLIRGDNGAGKTSFFHAVNFVFFGEPSNQKGKSVNVLAAREGDGETSVKVFFDHEGQKYELRRTLKFKKTEMTTTNKEGIKIINKGATLEDVEFSAKEDQDIEWSTEKGERAAEQRKYINRIIPEQASKYYMFDGEKMKEYTATGEAGNNTKVIEKIIGVAAIENAITDLTKLERSYAKTIKLAKTTTPEVAEFQSKIDKADTSNELTEKELESFGIELENAENERDQNERWLSANETIKTCFDNIEAEEEKKDKAEEKLEILSQTKAKFHSNLFPILITQELLGKISAIKPLINIHPQSLANEANQSISHDKCMLCDRDLDPASKSHLETLSAKTVDSTSDFNTIFHRFAGKHAVPALQKEWKELKQQEWTSALQVQNAESSIKENKEKIPLEAAREGRAKQNEKWKQSADAEARLGITITGINAKIDDANNRKKTNDENIEEWEAEIKKISKDETIIEFQEYSNTAKKFINAFEKLKENVVQKQVDAIQQRGTAVLSQIKTDNESHWRALKLDKNRVLHVEMELGGEKVWQTASPDEWSPFSEGQRNIAAFSFVEAVTGFAAESRPCFIDTPFARLDVGKTYGFAKYLATTKQDQTIILYQPKEIKDNEQGLEELLSKCADHYEIQATQDHFQSKIVELDT